ncbi:F-box/kelch-repeat protein SKIP6 [Gastrolobium bilobum]|uniref:F-box/kelch-repeat protein SKIP6 n=1 Tax=Gastrolobium bilobum TaxID=150636 RepID=UPI002AB08A1E|nr:F-box/kelch-repeat protein SKIP6 [Gastrolobium bilobum]
MSSSSSSEATTVNYNLIPSLPDDVALNCLARLPRHHHPTLSLVSKPIRNILSSPLFFNTRSLLQSTQHLLYLSLHSRAPTLQWFTLHHNPNLNLNLLVPIPPIPSPAIGSAYAVLGHTIYVIGGSINDIPSPHVWLLDCRFHRWLPGPAMRVGREFAAAGVVDGKIYVIGGCVADTWARSANWAEVLDPAVGRWERVASPVDVREKWMHASAVVENKVFAMADRGGIVFDPRSGAWESVGTELDLGWRGRACVVDGILYCYDYLGKIKGFDVKGGVWKELKGLEKGLPRFLCGATMADFGGKLVVVWECQGSGKEMEIWCAEIVVNKNIDGELWGEVGWFDKVLSVPKGSSIVHCSSVSL